MNFEEILWPIYKEKLTLTKQDVTTCKELPSYNTCLRKGLSLSALNKEFSARLVVGYCECCGVSLKKNENKVKFCSRSCSAKVSNLKRKKTYRCAECQKNLKAKSSKFCSHECFQKHRHRTAIELWKSGQEDFGPRRLKRFLTETVGYACATCGISDWAGKPITLELEHKNGDSEDNSPENLCLLCPNCHSQTPTYKAKNWGNGRHKRRERYKAGLSY